MESKVLSLFNRALCSKQWDGLGLRNREEEEERRGKACQGQDRKCHKRLSVTAKITFL